MIIDALWAMLFGMLGIFIVMGLIILTVSLLNKASTKKPSSKEDTGE
ncbi:MAG: sodium pump decarboxylase gamma subunit [Oscillospiraceae bacterium]